MVQTFGAAGLAAPACRPITPAAGSETVTLTAGSLSIEDVVLAMLVVRANTMAHSAAGPDLSAARH